MRIPLAFLLCCACLRADFSYRSSIQITGGELYDSLGAGRHTHDPVAVTRLIRGRRMAILSHQHTAVIDTEAETLTEIDFAKKTYWVIPFAQIKKTLDDALARGPHETAFKVSIQPPGAASKPVGVLNASESVIAIKSASAILEVNVDAWLGTVPGYEQMRDFIAGLAAKMGADAGYAYAAGFADPALHSPQALQGFNQAVKAVNGSVGAAFETTIKIISQDRSVAEATMELSHFGGGAQDQTKFVPPANFKKVDAPVPAAP